MGKPSLSFSLANNIKSTSKGKLLPIKLDLNFDKFIENLFKIITDAIMPFASENQWKKQWFLLIEEF